MCFGGSNTSTVQNTSNLPTWYSDAMQGLITRSDATSRNPYPTGALQQVAGFNPVQQGAMQGVADVQGQWAPLMNAAAGSALGSTTMWPNAPVQSYMNPYMQNVVDMQKQQAQVDYDRAKQGRDAKAVSSGAFGGSRGVLEEMMAQQGLGALQNNIQMTGLNQAYNQAQGQWNTDLDRNLKSSGILGELAKTGQGLNYADLNALSGVGGQLQGQQQRELDTNSQNAMNFATWPQQQQQFLSGIINSIPNGTFGKTTTSTTPTSPLAQGLGLGVTSAALLGQSGAFGAGGYLTPIWDSLFGKKEGGAIKGFAKGGALKGYAGGGNVWSNMSDDEFNEVFNKAHIYDGNYTDLLIERKRRVGPTQFEKDMEKAGNWAKDTFTPPPPSGPFYQPRPGNVPSTRPPLYKRAFDYFATPLSAKRTPVVGPQLDENQTTPVAPRAQPVLAEGVPQQQQNNNAPAPQNAPPQQASPLMQMAPEIAVNIPKSSDAPSFDGEIPKPPELDPNVMKAGDSANKWSSSPWAPLTAIGLRLMNSKGENALQALGAAGTEGLASMDKQAERGRQERLFGQQLKQQQFQNQSTAYQNKIEAYKANEQVKLRQQDAAFKQTQLSIERYKATIDVDPNNPKNKLYAAQAEYLANSKKDEAEAKLQAQRDFRFGTQKTAEQSKLYSRYSKDPITGGYVDPVTNKPLSPTQEESLNNEALVRAARIHPDASDSVRVIVDHEERTNPGAVMQGLDLIRSAKNPEEKQRLIVQMDMNLHSTGITRKLLKLYGYE